MKKRLRKLSAIILSVSLSVTSISWDGMYARAAEEEDNRNLEMEKSTGKEAMETLELETEGESIEKKTEYSTIYDLGGNKKMEVIFGSDVRFQDENGELVDYDASLIRLEESESLSGKSLEGYSYTNAQGDMKNYLPEVVGKETPVLLEREGYSISFYPGCDSEEEERMLLKESETERESLDINEAESSLEDQIEPASQAGTEALSFSEAKVEEQEITDLHGEEQMRPMAVAYEGDNVSYKYESSDIGVKEEIVLDTVPEKNYFVHEFRTEGLSVRKNTLDEGFSFYDKETGELVGGILPPNMNDASGEAYSEDIVCKIEEKEENTFLLITTVAWEYLRNEDRVYPVTIDPSVNWTGTSKIADPYVCNGSTYQNYNFYTSGITCLSVGHSNSQGLYRNYLKFTGLASSIKGKYIESAKLAIYETGGGTKGKVVQAHRVTADWQPSTITWNKKPGNDSSSYSSITTTNTMGAGHTLDLTSFARQVASSAVKDYGIMLSMKNESNTGNYTQFYNSRAATASYRPKLTIVYYDGPATPSSVKASPIHMRPGTAVSISWAGISSRSLNRIEYRLAKYNDATGEQLGNTIEYNAASSLGKTAAGTATVSGSNTWAAGCYKLYVRGVDNGGIKGSGRGDVIHIDGTAPILTAASITPSGYTANQTPTLMWTASDAHFSRVQYQVGNNAYVDAGTAAIGSAVLPAAYFPNSGTYTVRVRAVDKAGNISAVKTLNYFLDRTAPAIGSLAMTPAAGVWTTNGNPLIQFANIAELQAGLDTGRVEYCMVPEGQGQGSYKKGMSLSYTSSSNPWAGSFRLDSADQARGDGSYTIFVRFWDKVSNPSISYLSYKKDINAPTGTISSSLPNDNLHDTVQITADLSDGSGSGIKNSSLVLKNTSGTTVSTIYSNFTTASVTKPLDTTTLRNGAYKLVLTVSDNVNHIRTIETAVTIKNQLKAPKVTGSNTNDGRATITWSQEVGKTPFREMQCKLPGKTTWTKVSDLKNGAYQFSMSSANQEYTVPVRGVDADGVAGKEAAAVCVYDTVNPRVAFISMEQGVLKGSVSDQYLDHWKIESKEKGHSVSEYQQIATGTKAVQNDILTIVKLESLDYQIGHTYEFRLTAWDKAGNTNSTVYEHTKKADDTGAVYVQPIYEIAWPQYAKGEFRQYRIPMNTNYFEVQGEKESNIKKTSWYINNQKIGEENNNSTRTNVLDFHKIKGNYKEGTDYNITAECTDTSGKVTYSVPVLKKAFKQNLIEPPYSGFNTEIRDQKIVISNLKDPGRFEKKLTFQDPLVSFSIQANGGNITYSVKTSDSEWVRVEERAEYRISQLFPGRLTVTDLTIQAEMIRSGSMIPEISVFRLEGDTILGEQFQLSEMDNYTPEFVSAVSKINYKTYLNWSRIKEKDTVDFSKEKPVSIPDNVSYEIYRATDEEALRKMTIPVADCIRSDYFSEMNINYGEAFYYRIRAVGTKKNTSTGKTEKVYSSFSPIFFTKVADGDEYVKLLGNKPYWSYEDFSTPNGNGGVEKSRGNFTYSQTDAEIPNENLAVTLDRTYNNQASTVSSLGQGWNHNYDVELLNINESDRLIDRKAVKDETGTIFLFEKVSSGSYASSMGKYITLKAENRTEHVTILAKNGNRKIDTDIVSSYTMRTKDNLEYRFNSGGQLIYLTEPNNSFVLLEYDEKTGRLVAAVTNQNLITKFNYVDQAKEKADEYVQQGKDQSEEIERESRGEGAVNDEEGLGTIIDMDHLGGITIPVPSTSTDATVSQAVTNLALVQSVTLPDGGQIDYEYDNRNRLKSVTRKSDAKGAYKVVYRYEYDQRDNLTEIQDAKGNPYRIAYDGKKVSEVFYPQVYGKQESIKFAYRDIQEGNAVYETVIRKGLNGKYGLPELVKSSRDGNTLYSKDEKGVECTYTYEDNLPQTTEVKSEYQEIVNDTVVTKEGVRNSKTTYNKALNMNPVSDVDADQNSTVYEYANQSSEILDDLPTRIAEDSEGKSISDCSYTYDAYGNEIKELDQVTGDSVECTYYGQGSEFSGEIKQEVEKTRVISESGAVSYAVTTRSYQYVYNASSGVREERITEVTGEKSVTSVFRYDRMGNLVYEDDGLGTVSTFTYDYLGRMIGASYSEGGITSNISRTYDDNGTLIRETGKDGTVSEYTYDSKNQVIQKVISKGNMSRTYKTGYDFEWRDSGNGNQELIRVITNTTPGGKESRDYMNQMGWTIESVSGGVSVKTEYDKHGEGIVTRTGAEDGSGDEIVILTLYDNAGNAWATIQNPLRQGDAWKVGEESILNKETFDARGNRLSATDGMGTTMNYAYDELSRLTEVSLQDGAKKQKLMQYQYDIHEADGTISAKTTDAHGNVSKEYTDWEGQTVRVTDQGDGMVTAITTNYQHDKKGNVTRETYTDGNYKTYEYDGRNRLIKVSYFKADGTGTLVTKYTYSSSDQILTMEDFRYEGANQVRYRYTAYEYDGMDRMTASAEWDGSTIPTSSQIQGRQIRYEYDADGNLTWVIYSKAENHVVSLHYLYNENGWLNFIRARMDDHTEHLLREYLYDPDGKIKEIKTYPEFLKNDFTTHIRQIYQYDSLMRITRMEYRDSRHSQDVQESYDYTYDKNSNILSEKIRNAFPVDQFAKFDETRTHSYDSRGRLVSTDIVDIARGRNSSITYTYDALGNRVGETEGAVETAYQYNSLNQMTGTVKKVNGIEESRNTFTYDANGNLIKERDASQNKETLYTYDTANRLSQVSATVNGQQVLNQKNTYNGDGQRIEKQENGKTTKYFYQNGSVQYTEDAHGNKTSFHLLGLDNNVIATGSFEGWSAGGYFLLNRDIRGSISVILDEDGYGFVSYNYSDFGKTKKYEILSFPNEICYSGGIYDESTGLYYLNARYYDPESGRFLTQDTYRGEADADETWNLYAYCANNPVNSIDPSGHLVLTLSALYAIGATITYLYSSYVVLSRAYSGSYGGRPQFSYNLSQLFSHHRPADSWTIVNPTPAPAKPQVTTPQTPANKKPQATPKNRVSNKPKVTPKGKIVKRPQGVQKNRVKKPSITKNKSGKKGSAKSPSYKKVNEKYLERKGIDAHDVKGGIYGDKSISRYDLYVDKNTGELFVSRKGGGGEKIPTGNFIK